MMLDRRQIAQLVTNLVGGVTGHDGTVLNSAGRGVKPVARARQVAMYLAHTSCSLSLSATGEAFGRDKSTVGHAVQFIEDLRDDPEFDGWMSDLEVAIKQLSEISERSGQVLSGMWQPTRQLAMGYDPSIQPA
ncbi:MAG: hypothetical protein CMK07_13085 [Ponticaulis sp.]|nr:hypothetical protein [Ponticaulis sp.]